MATISESINGVLAKTRDVAGVANVVRSVLPPSLSGPLDRLFGDSRTTGLQSEKGLNVFFSNLNRLRGVQKTSHFYVRLPIPYKLLNDKAIQNIQSQSMSISGSDQAREIGLLCEACSLPGVSLNTSEIRRYGIGVQEKRPYLPTFTDQSFSFIGDNTGKIHRFFYLWMNSIVRYNAYPTQAGSKFIGLEPFEVEYDKNTTGIPNYKVDIIITTVDETNRVINELQLFNAYPIFLGDVQLNWSETDSFVRFPVTFTFSHWRLEKIDVSDVLKTQKAEPTLLDRLIKGATALQVLASLKKPTGVGDIINVVNNAKIITSNF